MLPPVFTLLKASSDVRAIVGSNPPRIYRHGHAPQRPDNLPLDQPYITWLVVVGTPNNNISESPPADRMTVQVDCWHQRDAGIEVLATAARNALEVAGHMTSFLGDTFEPETKLYRMSMQFDIFTAH